MSVRSILRPLYWAAILFLPVISPAASSPDTLPSDPSFNIQAIINDPLDARVLSTETEGGLRFETVEFTSQTFSGTPIRVSGILGLPNSEGRHPAIFFSMPGMAPASKIWSGTFARKGYVTLTITLPSGPLPPPPPFEGQVLQDGNLTAFAVAQMRGITYLTHRSEVDPTRIGIGGSSYGGFFATLIAGADPRIKAGMSFFAGGHNELGSHLPQFTSLTNRNQVELWNKTIDPAWRLRQRAVPFLWGVAANDHWFQFPSVIETFRDSIGDKRLAISPHGDHGFDLIMDQQLIDWFDTQLARPEDKGLPPVRPAHNQALDLSIYRNAKGLKVSWSVTGTNPIVNAEVLVSFGPDAPWQGWIYRLHQPFPVIIIPPTVSGAPWTCETYLPVPHPDLPLLVYGNVFDDQGVLSSTLPKTVIPRQLGIDTPINPPDLNAFPWGDFEPDDVEQLVRSGRMPTTIDSTVFKSGHQSLWVDPPADKHIAPPWISLKLLHVPSLSHRLTGWIKSRPAGSVEIQVRPVIPPDWNRPIIDQLRRELSGDSRPIPAADPSASQVITTGEEWQRFTLDSPAPAGPIEGYELFARSSTNPVTFWLDEIRFEPRWPKVRDEPVQP
jgi:dienelactone hydrolase